MSMQPQRGMVPVSMTVGSNVATSIPSMMTNNPRAQSVTTYNIGNTGQRQPTMIHNIQSVGSRAPTPVSLQTLPSLQPVPQGHLLVKTENGEYRLLRVGTAPEPVAKPPVALPPLQALNTNQQQQQQLEMNPPVSTTAKCRNFLASILSLSCREPMLVQMNVRNLIQELINSQMEPEQFCARLERLLNASPQPHLVGFLKKTLPPLKQSLITKEIVIEGIYPPSAQVAMSVSPSPSNVPKSGKAAITIQQNIPVQTMIDVSEMSRPKRNSNFCWAGQSTPHLSTVLTSDKVQGKAFNKKNEKKTVKQYKHQLFCDDKMAGEDDVNDVAAMGGVNLAQESYTMLGSTEVIGRQIRSCKDQYMLPMSVMQARIKAICAKHELGEPSVDVAGVMCHAVHERLKNIVEKLAVVAQHRNDIIKFDTRYETTQDVKGQLKFLEELDRVNKKRRDESEREQLLRAAKSRSKDPEQSKLKTRGKEMQRAEIEETQQRDANLTALNAIGPRKKVRLDVRGGVGDSASNSAGLTGQSQTAMRMRLNRINKRDMLFLLEQEKDTSRSLFLYRCYLN